MSKLKFAALLLGLFAVALPFFSPEQPVNAQDTGKQVWAFYMGFWTPGGWDQRANILSDFPLERYNSADGNVAARQIEQAQSAGIDAFIVSWFGPAEGQTTATLNVMLDQAAARGFHVGAALDVFPAGTNRSKEELVSALSYLVYDRANHAAWVRVDGKPVIHLAFQENAGLSDEEWLEIRNSIDPDRNTIWVAEGLNGCCLHNGAFDGMYAFNVAWGGGANSRGMGATYANGGTFFSPTVHPGWDETNIAAAENRPNPTSPKDRANGAFLRGSWNGAVGTGAKVIMIVSWNEFMENSHIEPSVVYGSQALDVLRPLIAAWKGVAAPAAPAPIAPSGEAMNNATPQAETVAPAPTGTVVTANAQLNVRREPSADSVKLGTVNAGEVFAVLGESNGWYKILFNGGEGWVSGDFVTVSQQ
jgi:hypothetical protein